MKTSINIILVLLVVSLSVVAVAQDGSSWIIAQGRYGFIDLNKTKTYSDGFIQIFYNYGIPAEPGILMVGWESKVSTQKIPQKVTAEFFLKDGKNLDSVEIFFYAVSPHGGWAQLGQRMILNGIGSWKSFTWDLSIITTMDSVSSIGFSYQLRTISSADSTGAVIELRNLSIRSITGVFEPVQVPKSFKLEQNYPNPFNPSTKISFFIPNQEHVTLKVYNMLGTEVSTLLNKMMSVGNHKVSFDGSKLSSGTYFYRLQAGNSVEIKKMLLLR